MIRPASSHTGLQTTAEKAGFSSGCLRLNPVELTGATRIEQLLSNRREKLIVHVGCKESINSFDRPWRYVEQISILQSN